MKRTSIGIAALFIFLASFSSLAQTNKETRSLDSFDKVSISGSFNVYLKEGSRNEVVVETKNVDLSEIETTVSGSTLKIDKKSNKWKNYGNKTVNIWVTYKEISAIHSSGSSDIATQSPIRTNELKVKGSGSGDMELDIDVRNFNLSVSGSCDIDLKGKTEEQSITLTGSGDIDAFSLNSNKTHIRISGSGDIDVQVSDELNAQISGSGDVRYKGNPPRHNVSVTGSGNVSKM